MHILSCVPPCIFFYPWAACRRIYLYIYFYTPFCLPLILIYLWAACISLYLSVYSLFCLPHTVFLYPWVACISLYLSVYSLFCLPNISRGVHKSLSICLFSLLSPPHISLSMSGVHICLSRGIFFHLYSIPPAYFSIHEWHAYLSI